MFGCHDSKTLSLPWRKKHILTFLFLSLNIKGIPVFSRAQNCYSSLGQLCSTFSHSNTFTSHLWRYGRTILNKHQQQSRYEKTSSSKKVSATGLAHKLNRGTPCFTRDTYSFSLEAIYTGSSSKAPLHYFTTFSYTGKTILYTMCIITLPPSHSVTSRTEKLQLIPRSSCPLLQDRGQGGCKCETLALPNSQTFM